MKVSMAIAVRDEKEAHRKKKGDIISVRPSGWQWGTGEVKNHLILEVTLPDGVDLSTSYLLAEPQFEGGKVKDTADMTPKAKRRFKIDLDELSTLFPTIDWGRVADVNDPYQPFSVQGVVGSTEEIEINSADIVTDKHFGKKLKTKKDFDDLRES